MDLRRPPTATIRQNDSQVNDATAHGHAESSRNHKPLNGSSSSQQLIAPSTGTCRSSVARFSYDGRERGENQVLATDIESETSSSSSANGSDYVICPPSEDLDTNSLCCRSSNAAKKETCCNKLRIDPRVASFWFMGLLNNIPYTIMLAGAKDIAEGGTALVFVANVFPSLIVKLSAPYWFPMVTYGTRMVACTFFFVVSFMVVAYFSSAFEADSMQRQQQQEDGSDNNLSLLLLKRDVAFELIGVMLGSLACGMGEASLLALAGRFAAAEPTTRNVGNDKEQQQRSSQSNQQQQKDQPTRAYLTAFSSGTGIAGVLGYAYVTLFHYWMGLSFASILVMANIFPLLYCFIFFQYLGEAPSPQDKTHTRAVRTSHSSRDFLLLADVDDDDDEFLIDDDDDMMERNNGHKRIMPNILGQHCGAVGGGCIPGPPIMERASSTGCLEMQDAAAPASSRTTMANDDSNTPRNIGVEGSHGYSGLRGASSNLEYQPVDGLVSSEYRTATRQAKSSQHSTLRNNAEVSSMTCWEKSKLVASLWPYTVPLFLVYAAEYALQSGTWTAIGFPVDDEHARDMFYEYGNWMYQIGVFFSRSSGTVFQASMFTLWLMPCLQIANLGFFMWTASTHVWYLYNWSLLFVCLFVGCLGGGVYVNAFTRISADLPAHQVEFALSSASVADSFGILLADISGLYIQSCLYAQNNISGAAVTCPFSSS